MKKGFSLIMMIGVLFIFLVLATVGVVSYTNINRHVELQKFSSELFMIQDRIEEYYLKNGKFPLKEEVNFDLKKVPLISKSQFNNCKKENEIVKFYKINFSEAEIILNNRGFGNNADDLDLYVFSLDNNKVYYLKGFEYDRYVHYTFNEEMYRLSGISRVD